MLDFTRFSNLLVKPVVRIVVFLGVNHIAVELSAL